MANVVALASGATHGITKAFRDRIELVAGYGVAGDAHYGATVMHRSRRAKFPDMANLRQVHLIQASLYQELEDKGFEQKPGSLGENIALSGLDLLALPKGTRLTFPSGAEIELTGLRNPCSQLNGVAPGLMDALIGRDAAGELVRKGGVMAVVLTGGEVRCGDAVAVKPGTDGALQPV